MLPNFVIIGAMKAGTTSLYAYLRSHPQVFMASPKELDFFNRHWGRGRSWYEAKFAGAAGAVAVGEVSPLYTKGHLWGETAARMASLIPHARLIYSLRDPVERMRSHYLHQVADGSEDRPLERAFSEDADPRTRDYLLTSSYASQLERYLEFFRRDQLLAITSERLRHDRMSTLQNVFRFLGVNEGWLPDNLEWEAHRTDRKVIRHPLAERLKELPWYGAALRRTPLTLKKVGHRLTTRKVEATMPEELRADLCRRLAPDVERLRTLLDTPAFEGWGIA